jgi:hypothetical protein
MGGRGASFFRGLGAPFIGVGEGLQGGGGRSNNRPSMAPFFWHVEEVAKERIN